MARPGSPTRLEAEGIAYLHCPVFIGPAMARKAQGTILAAGPAERSASVREALERQAARVEYLGERPDLAAIYKLCGNASGARPWWRPTSRRASSWPARKDVRLMMETAAGGALAVLPGVAARMDQLIAEGVGAPDLAVLARDAVA